MNKIVFFDANNFSKEILNEKINLENIEITEKILNKNNVKDYSDAEIICISVHTKVDSELLNNFPNLKLICLLSTGYDHINMKECENREIIVTNVPGYSNESVAEHSLALLFTISKRIHLCDIELENKNIIMNELMGFELKNKTIGIIGTGSIGLSMIKLSKGVGMNVIAFDINHNIEAEKEFEFKYVEMNELLETSDIISLHVPLNKHTQHLLSKDKFNKMKQGVVIINTARGGLIDSESLLNALDSGKVDFAGLDVFEDEDAICTNESCVTRKLIEHSKVVATPHSAFNTKEAIESLLDITINNIKLFLAKKEVENKIN